jgi:hypothetical protein
MGYACPVCETPQMDARHLANHMAFTAMMRHEDHEAWLDEHAPGWSESGEADLAARIEGLVEEVEFPQVFEDTTGHDHGHDHDDPIEERSGALFDDDPGFLPPAEEGEDLDPETRRVLEEARDLTERMLAEDEEDDEDEENGKA